MKLSELKLSDITLQNFKNISSAHKRKLLGLKEHEKEQVNYRASFCADCIEKQKCVGCGCDVPFKFWQSAPCSKNRWPAMMNPKEWEAFKEEKGINLNELPRIAPR